MISGQSAAVPGLELRSITERFGSLVANDAVDLAVRPAEIHHLLGENGAGRSTLINILCGFLQPDDGQIVVDGRPRVFSNPERAIAAGIGMVHQHVMLVDVCTVAENMIVGREASSGGFLSLGPARRRVRELSDRCGLRVDPDALVEQLPVGVQQRVEVLKALANDARYLIFDGPTAVLTPQEIDELMQVIRALRDEARAIVFITRAVAGLIGRVRAPAADGEPYLKS